MIIRVHLVSAIRVAKTLNAIPNEDVQRLKTPATEKAPKTVNNVLTVLNVMLKKAVEWDVIERMPCPSSCCRCPKGSTGFYDFDEFERLVAAARRRDPRASSCCVGREKLDCGCGEMVALEWTRHRLRQAADVRAAVGVEGAGRVTERRTASVRAADRRLAAALREHRHLRGPRCCISDDGSPLTEGRGPGRGPRAARRAGLVERWSHMLRHTFCSHLAMLGAPARAIQELAGHRTSSRRSHVNAQRTDPGAGAALDAAFQLLAPRSRS